MDRFFTVTMIFCLGFALFLVGFAGFTIFNEVTKTEVETYTVGCEVTKTAYAEEATGTRTSRPNYMMGVRCDDFATTFEITEEQFAKYTEKDIVEIEVTVWEYSDGTMKNTYKIIE
jgi:hypothetical protein